MTGDTPGVLRRNRPLIVLNVVGVALAVLAIAKREWALLAVCLVFLPLNLWAVVKAERARRDPTWKPWGQRQLLERPLLAGIWTGIVLGLLMTLTMASENDAPIGRALLVSLAICVPLGLAFAYVGRNDLRRREAGDPRD